MSAANDKNRVLVQCERCELIFKLTPKQAEDENIDLCPLVPEKDLGARRKQCMEIAE